LGKRLVVEEIPRCRVWWWWADDEEDDDEDEEEDKPRTSR
jgi:hypothetical protein